MSGQPQSRDNAVQSLNWAKEKVKGQIVILSFKNIIHVSTHAIEAVSFKQFSSTPQ